MAFTIGEYQDIFLEEADEQLQELNQSLLALEKNPDNIEIDTINNIFRTAHSLKSSAAFVGLNDLSDLAHHMENLLQGIRDNTMSMSAEIIDILFQCFDIISSIINSVASGEEPSQILAPIINKIKEISDRSKKGSSNSGTISNDARELKKDKVLPKIQYTKKDIKRIIDGLKSLKSCCEVDIYLEPNAPMKWIKIQLIMNNLEQISDILKTTPDADKLTDKWSDDLFKVVLLTDQPIDRIRESCEIDLVIKIDMRKISLSNKDDKLALRFHDKETLLEEKQEEIIIDDLEEQKVSPEDEDTARDEGNLNLVCGRRSEDKRTPGLKIVKVSIDKLDLLLNNVGELVIANSGFFRLFEDLKKSDINKSISSEFKNKMDQMSRIAKDLQSGIMKTRMVPIGQVLSRFNRPVRDLAKEFGKNINFEIKGEDTELDKKVIDVIGEPLLHLIRNSIDHGIEPPDERSSIGKPEEARVTINAYQGGNQIFVEIGDDGRGLDIEKIKELAIKRGLVTSEILANMDNDEISEFIFHPGFSTADVITDISGRGVGMNVVKETVNELNGSVRIETEPGMGTTFVLAFPLTLAIIPAIMVKVNREMYAIPLPDVIETIKIIQSDITTIEGREVVNLRGEILSLIRLNEFIGIDSNLKENQKIPVVVVGYGNRKIGVIVDNLEGKQEIVIKSLEENYTNIEGLAGASILGDGSICLILDIASMINKVIADEDKTIRQRKFEKIEEMPEAIEENMVVSEDKMDSSNSGYISFEAEKDTSKDMISSSDSIIKESETIANQTEITESAKDEVSGNISEDIIFEKAEEETDSSKTITENQLESNILNKSDSIFGSDSQKEIINEKDNVEEKVKDSLNDFRKELEENIKSTVDDTDNDNYVMNTLQIESDEMEKIDVIANIGIANAAESLSKILDKSVSLSIPEVEIIPINTIARVIGDIDSVYLGVFMPVVGDINGAILFSFTEESGFELIDMLYGTSTGMTKELNNDGESALKEVTNIVGSSMINSLSEKVDLTIRPEVPTIVHDYIQSTVDSMLIQNNISGDCALFMNTYFYHQDDRVLGKLLIISETESLKKMIEKLRD